MKMWNLYFDGACRGNPGESSYGAVLYEGTREVNTTRGKLGIATNNQAEYHALINGMKMAIDQIGENGTLNVYGDSKLVLMQVEGKWKCNNERLRGLLDKVRKFKISCITYNHVLRNKNKRADELANIALDE
jgi:ribonuclease HI